MNPRLFWNENTRPPPRHASMIKNQSYNYDTLWHSSGNNHSGQGSLSFSQTGLPIQWRPMASACNYTIVANMAICISPNGVWASFRSHWLFFLGERGTELGGWWATCLSHQLLRYRDGIKTLLIREKSVECMLRKMLDTETIYFWSNLEIRSWRQKSSNVWLFGNVPWDGRKLTDLVQTFGTSKLCSAYLVQTCQPIQQGFGGTSGGLTLRYFARCT